MASWNADDPDYDPNAPVPGNVNTTPAPAGESNTTPTAPDVSNTNPGSTSTPNTPGEAGPSVLDINKGNMSNPTLPNGTQYTSTPIEVKDGEMLDPNKYKLNPAAPVQAQQAQGAQAAAPVKTAANTYQAETGGVAPEATAQQGTVSSQAQVQAQTQQGLSPELKQTLDDFNTKLSEIGLDPNETVQGQYSKLMDFGPGNIPAWAQGAYRAANQKLAARGLDASTIGAEAVTTALMQAALPIAAADAQAFQTLKLTKLDKEAQGVFLRAGYIAQLDMNNLNNRQQAAVVNAQSFLAMDMKNLDARQQTAIINTQSRLQKMLADNAAVNASRQFNATSQNQTDQFYADLGTRVGMFNASQMQGLNMFNSGQTNAMSQFNAQLQNDRDKFNTQNAVLIDQANATWLRNINLANTQNVNQQNLVNTQNLLGISNTAIANMLQLTRDTVAYDFQAGQNDLDRSLQRSLTSLQNEEWYKRFNTQQKSTFWQSVGGFVASAAGSAVDQWSKNDFSTSWLDDDNTGSTDSNPGVGAEYGWG